MEKILKVKAKQKCTFVQVKKCTKCIYIGIEHERGGGEDKVYTVYVQRCFVKQGVSQIGHSKIESSSH
jgi:hypothetical protein